MVSKGGDSDTNCAIVGGLIGAAEGYTKIPKNIKTSMLMCRTEGGLHNRPEFLCPAKCNLLVLIGKLYENLPDNDIKIIN